MSGLGTWRRWRGLLPLIAVVIVAATWLAVLSVGSSLNGLVIMIDVIGLVIALGVGWLLPRVNQPLLEVGWGMICLAFLLRVLMGVAPVGSSVSPWLGGGLLAGGLLFVGLGLWMLRGREMERAHVCEAAHRGLEDQRRRLGLVERHLPLVIWTVDADMVITASAGSGLATVDLTENEVRGMTLQELMKDQDGGSVLIDAHRRAQSGASVSFRCQFNGEWFDCRVEPLRTERGEVTSTIGVATNATRYSVAETQLRASEERLALLLRQSPLAAIVWDTDFRVVEWNASAERIFGFTAEEALGRHAAELMVPSDLRELVDQVFESLLLQKGGERSTNENVTKDRRRILCEWYNTPLCDAGGRVIGVASLAQDITDRAIAEKALRQSETRFRTMIDQSPFGVAVFRSDGRPTYANSTFGRLWDFTEAELSGFLDQYNIFGDTAYIVSDCLPSIRRAFSGETTTLPRMEYVPSGVGRSEADSHKPWIRTRLYPIRDPEGGIREVVILYEDVTDRMQAERELREVEGRFRILAENVPGTIYLCRNDERYTMLYLNDAVESLTGYAKEDFLHDRISFVDLMHPDDVESVRVGVDAALQERRRFHLVYRLKHRSGEWRTVEERGVGVFHDDELMYLEGFLSDITSSRDRAVGNHIIETPSRGRVEPLEAVARASIERSQAFARLSDALRQSGSGVRLRDLIRQSFGEHADVLQSGRVVLDGESVTVPSSKAVPLAMVLHEMVTNAVRHGCLSSSEGRLDMRWVVVADRALDLTWSERGGPSAASHGPPGVGSRLIDAIVGQELGGRVDLDVHEDGVIGRFVIPIDHPVGASSAVS